MAEIEDILAKLDPKTRARFIQAKGHSPEKQLTPSIGLNAALRGGFGFGRQVMIWGNKSAGKSSFCLQMIGMAQKQGRTCAWIDGENSYDDSWAARLGVDSDRLLLSSTKTIQGMVEESTGLMEAGVDIIVVDSISTLLPAIFFEKDSEELKLLNDTKQIGAHARDMTNAVNMLNFANKNTLLVLLSQQRNQFGAMHATHIPSGGMAVKFNSSTVVKLWSSEAEANQIKGSILSVGDKMIEQKVGRPVNWQVDYNKLGPMGQTGLYDFYYQGEVGIDRVGEVLDYAEKYGIISRGGAWYTINEERLQGRPKALEYLRKHPDITDELEAKILG